MKTNLKFFYNGIKSSDGKLQKCSYDIGNLTNYPADTITIYADRSNYFSDETRAAFTVQNNSNSMTDYFEADYVRVLSAHPLYAAVLAAAVKANAKDQARADAYQARVNRAA